MSYNNEYIEWSEWDSEKNNCLENNNFIDFINNNNIGFQPSTPIESKSINSWIRMLSLIGKAILTSFPVSSSYTSIGPSSNIDDIVTFIQDEFSTKISSEINKIKPDAWEERKFNVDMEGTPIEFTTYNPITDSNTPVNIQKSFIDKETYSSTDKINSFSFSASSPSIFAYLVCGNPSLTLNELFGLEETAKNYIVLANTDVGGDGEYWLLINCRIVDTFSLYTSSLSFDRHDNNTYIDKISTDDDKLEHSMLTAKAVDQYYLKKTDASNTYLSKVDASNTYATKSALKLLEYDYFDADLTPTGLAKMQSNVTIGTSITLRKNTDFVENIYNTDLAHKTAIFSLYLDDNEEVYISENIKLDIGRTTSYYSNNDQPYTWLTGLGVIKLGPASQGGNQYLCYITYCMTYDTGLIITPIRKLD